MRLGEWCKTAPNKESLGDRVLTVLRPVLLGLGAEADAECWVAWGKEPELRFSVLVPTVVGLVVVSVRPSDPDGPRATARLIRWSKLAMTELGIEASGGHRVVGVRVESLVLEGADEEADRICEFVRGLMAGIDGRSPTGAVVPLPAAGQDAGDSAATAQKATPMRAAAGPRPPAPHRQADAPSSKIVPITSKAGSRPAADAAETPSGSTSEPLAAPAAPVPAEPAAPRTIPTPLAARAAAAHHEEQPLAGPIHPVPELEPEQPEWVGPHPIEEHPADELPKPRPWRP